MGGCPARPFGLCLFPGDGNGSPSARYPPFAARVSISIRMMIAAMGNKNLDCRD